MNVKIILTDENSQREKSFTGDITHLIVEAANLLDENVEEIAIKKGHATKSCTTK